MFEEAVLLSIYGDTPGRPIKMRNLRAYAQKHDAYPAPVDYLWAFLGNSDPSFDEHLYKRDHTDLWLRYWVPYSFTIQPYAASVDWPRATKEWSRFAQKHHLRYRILPAGSGWYNPERTVCVEFTHAYSDGGAQPFFYEEVVRDRERAELANISGEAHLVSLDDSQEFGLEYSPSAAPDSPLDPGWGARFWGYTQN